MATVGGLVSMFANEPSSLTTPNVNCGMFILWIWETKYFDLCALRSIQEQYEPYLWLEGSVLILVNGYYNVCIYPGRNTYIGTMLSFNNHNFYNNNLLPLKQLHYVVFYMKTVYQTHEFLKDNTLSKCMLVCDYAYLKAVFCYCLSILYEKNSIQICRYYILLIVVLLLSNAMHPSIMNIACVIHVKHSVKRGVKIMRLIRSISNVPDQNRQTFTKQNMSTILDRCNNRTLSRPIFHDTSS